MKQKDGAKEVRKSQEASGTKEAKEEWTDSAARMRSGKASKGQGPTPVESLELEQGLPKPPPRSPKKSTEPADSQKRCSGGQVKLRKHSEDLGFKLAEDDRITTLCLDPAGPLPPQLLHRPGSVILKMTRVLQAAC